MILLMFGIGFALMIVEGLFIKSDMKRFEEDYVESLKEYYKYHKGGGL